MQEDLDNGRLDGIHFKREFLTRCGWLVPPTEVFWFMWKKRNLMLLEEIGECLLISTNK